MPVRHLLLAAATGLLAALLAACPSAVQAPGDVLLGDFDFEVTLLREDCPFTHDVPAQFTGTVSLDSTTGRAFLSVNEFVQEGHFQEGWMTVGATASRILPTDCPKPPKLSVAETVEARLYPENEARDLAGCSWPVERPDAGSPSWDPSALRDGGLDVRLICGTIHDRFSPDPEQASDCTEPPGASAVLEPCEALFTLSGRRH